MRQMSPIRSGFGPIFPGPSRAIRSSCHDAFNTDTAEVDDLKARYRAGKVGDVEVKTKLARAINAALEPMQERRRAVLAPDYVREIAIEGSRTARIIAQATMERVRTP